MADTLSIVTLVAQGLKTLQDAIEQLRTNQKDIYKLSRGLINETFELTTIRKSRPGNYAEIDRFLTVLIKELDTICVGCEALLVEPGAGLIKRAFKWCKNLYNADTVKKGIGELQERVRDAQHDFLVKNDLAMALNVEDLKSAASEIRDAVSELKVDIQFLVQEAERKPKEANKLFGVDRMTEAERKKALRRTSLDLSVTTKDENLFLLRFKIRTLKKALDTNAPTLYRDSRLRLAQGYEPKPDDPFYDVCRDACGIRRRQDALIETISLLDLLQNPDSLANTPALVLFIRADKLAWSLRSLGLRKEALHLSSIAHDVIQNVSKKNPKSFRDYLAKSLLTLSACRGDMGNLKEALEASREAVKIYRALAEGDPNTFNQGFARSLNMMSVDLGLVGRKDEALAAIREAEVIYRAPVEDDCEASKRALACFLNTLSLRLSDAGRKDESLTAIQEVVKIRRALASSDPENSIPDLARALSTLSNRLRDVGKRDEALAAIQEAERMFRALAEDNPDAFNPGLAMSLINLSPRLSDVGKIVEALAAIQEAEKLYRLLAETMSSEAFGPDLARSLNNLSNRLREVGRRREALVAIQESETIQRTLAEKDPVAFNPDLGMTLINLSLRLSAVGRKDEALAANQEAETIYRALADSNPDTFNPDLALCLNNLSCRLSDVGRKEAGLVAITEAVSIRRALAESNPDAFEQDLAESLSNLSLRLRDAGNKEPEQALAASEEAVFLYRRRYGRYPDFFCRFLPRALDGLRDSLLAVGRTEEAQNASEEARRIREL